MQLPSPLRWKDVVVSKASGFEQKPSFPLKRSQPDLEQGGMATHVYIASSPSLFFLWLLTSCTVLTFSPKWAVREVTRLFYIWSFLNELYHIHRVHRATIAPITECWQHLAMSCQKKSWPCCLWSGTYLWIYFCFILSNVCYSSKCPPILHLGGLRQLIEEANSHHEFVGGMEKEVGSLHQGTLMSSGGPHNSCLSLWFLAGMVRIKLASQLDLVPSLMSVNSC